MGSAGGGSAAPRRLLRRVTVVIADDDPCVRDALADLIGDDPALLLVGAAPDAAGAIELAVRNQPQVVVLDVQMPGGGLHAAREIRRRVPGTAVLALTACTAAHIAEQMRAAGAVQVLRKGDPGADVLDEIAGAARRPAIPA